MTTATLPKNLVDVLLHEVARLTKDTATLLANKAAALGQVMGRILLGAITTAAKAGNTGNGTLTLDATTPTLANARAGVYQVRFTAATTFVVLDPRGLQVGSGGVNGTAFANQIKFVTAAGGTAFVAGDGFDVTIAEGSRKVVPLDLAAVDGSQVASAVALDTKASSTADQFLPVAARSCMVESSALSWPAGITDTQKAAAILQLEERGILVRPGV